MSEDATLEVDGKTYRLWHVERHTPRDSFYDRHGQACEIPTADPWLVVKTSDVETRALTGKGAQRCRVTMPDGTAYAGFAELTGWTANFATITMTVRHLEAVPAKPTPATLDETTNPADVEWGEVRSAVAAKDWRRAWEVVGTDHTGEATPGEAYIFGNARRVSAVSAALLHWRKAEMESGTIFIGADAAQAWTRIKQIAAWESSAAAQYADRPPRRLNHLRVDRTEISIDGRIIAGYEEAMVGATADTIIIDDPVESDPELYGAERGVPGLFRNPFVPANVARVMTHGGGETYHLTINGERQTYTVPASSMPDIAGALSDYIGQPLTAATRAAVEATVRRVTQDSARIGNGNAAIRPNPAPHGPTRRRRR